MCILFIYMNPEPVKGAYRLIIASNRDEIYARPAQKAFRCLKTNIVGGRDLEPGREGGMWLGVSLFPEKLKFATLLNVTGEKKAGAGRGPLVYNYLKSSDSCSDFIDKLPTADYSAFNLVMLELLANGTIECYHHSNSPEDTINYKGIQTLGFGNSTPDSPFTKVKNGRQQFEEIINNNLDRDGLVDSLIQFLKSPIKHLPDEEMQKRAGDKTKFLSSIYVQYEPVGYGTRTHSILLVDDENNVEFIESTMANHELKQNVWENTTIKARL